MGFLNIVFENEYKKEDITFRLSLIQLKNSYVIFISDQDYYEIGTVTLALPPNELYKSQISTPLTTIGMTNVLLSNLITKSLTAKLKKPVLLFLLIKNKREKEERFMKILMECIDEFLKDMDKQTKSD